jgi:hypothetical protein
VTWGKKHSFFFKEHIMRVYEENMNHFLTWLFKEREIGFSEFQAPAA